MSFNSKLVRLKGVHQIAIKPKLILFQFQTGSIKRTDYQFKREDGYCFNSKLVRLKEADLGVSFEVQGVFQVQTGSIKRDQVSWPVATDTDRFQFQTGSIKRRSFDRQWFRQTMFQFQTGSIKSEPLHRRCETYSRFNSKLVRLKVRARLNGRITHRFQFQTGSIKSIAEPE